MKDRISIYVFTHKDGTASVDVHIPANMKKEECQVVADEGSNATVHKDVDYGIETEVTKVQVDEEDEGLLYDNLD